MNHLSAGLTPRSMQQQCRSVPGRERSLRSGLECSRRQALKVSWYSQSYHTRHFKEKLSKTCNNQVRQKFDLVDLYGTCFVTCDLRLATRPPYIFGASFQVWRRLAGVLAQKKFRPVPSFLMTFSYITPRNFRTSSTNSSGRPA